MQFFVVLLLLSAGPVQAKIAGAVVKGIKDAAVEEATKSVVKGAAKVVVTTAAGVAVTKVADKAIKKAAGAVKQKAQQAQKTVQEKVAQAPAATQKSVSQKLSEAKNRLRQSIEEKRTEYIEPAQQLPAPEDRAIENSSEEASFEADRSEEATGTTDESIFKETAELVTGFTKAGLAKAKAQVRQLNAHVQQQTDEAKKKIQPTLDLINYRLGQLDDHLSLSYALNTDSIKTQLVQAIQENNIDRVKLYASRLEEEDLIWITTGQGGTVAHHAVSEAKADFMAVAMLKELLHFIEEPDFLRRTDKNGQTVLHLAAKLGYYEVIAYLSGKPDFDTHFVDKQGFLPIQLAALQGDAKTVMAFFEAAKRYEARQTPPLPSAKDIEDKVEARKTPEQKAYKTGLSRLNWPQDAGQQASGQWGYFSYDSYLNLIELFASRHYELPFEFDLKAFPYVHRDWLASYKNFEEALKTAALKGHSAVFRAIAQEADQWFYRDQEQQQMWTSILVDVLEQLATSGYSKSQSRTGVEAHDSATGAGAGREVFVRIVQDLTWIKSEDRRRGVADVNDLRALPMIYSEDEGVRLTYPSFVHLAMLSGDPRIVKAVVDAVEDGGGDLHTHDGPLTALESLQQFLGAHQDQLDPIQKQNYLAVHEFLEKRTPKKPSVSDTCLAALGLEKKNKR